MSEEIIEKFFEEKDNSQLKPEDFLNEDSDERDDDGDEKEGGLNQEGGTEMSMTLKGNANIFGIEKGKLDDSGKYSGFDDLDDDRDDDFEQEEDEQESGDLDNKGRSPSPDKN